jgi:hypothetical protein
MAPEMYEEAEYNLKVDIFSSGFIVYDIVAEQPAVSANLKPSQIMKKVLNGWRPGFPVQVAAWVHELVGSWRWCDLAVRPPCTEILVTLASHEFRIVDGIDSKDVWRFLWSVEGNE